MGCDDNITNFNFQQKISTHTSRVGCDTFRRSYSRISSISTHTSRVGCDQSLESFTQKTTHFYSHIPCGMWLVSNLWASHFVLYFYSHIPCGMWQSALEGYLGGLHFYSHIPCGMWLQTSEQRVYRWKFLLTHPVWDVTTPLRFHSVMPEISTHTSRVGCDLLSSFFSPPY